MGNLAYARPSDIVTPNASWSALVGTVSTDPDYGVASLYDKRMAKPLKFIDEPITAIRLVGDFGAAQRLDAMALPNSNVPEGTVMQCELSDDGTFASAAVSVDMTMGTYGLDGHSASPWVDFTSASGYTTVGYRYASLYIPVTAVMPQIGELLTMANLRTFSQYPQFNGTRATNRPFLENIYTEFGQRRVIRRRIKMRGFQFNIKGNEQDYTDLHDLADDCGGVAVPFFCTRDNTVFTDGGLYGRLTPEIARILTSSEEWFSLNNLSIGFEEDSRSFPL